MQRRAHLWRKINACKRSGEVVNLHTVQIYRLAYGNIKSAVSVDICGEHRDVMPSSRELLAETMNREHRTTVSPRREVGGNHVQKPHGPESTTWPREEWSSPPDGQNYVVSIARTISKAFDGVADVAQELRAGFELDMAVR